MSTHRVWASPAGTAATERRWLTERDLRRMKYALFAFSANDAAALPDDEEDAADDSTALHTSSITRYAVIISA